MKRTHRTLLVLNYAVTFQDQDGFAYMEYAELKRYMSRKEMMVLYRTIKSGARQLLVSNAQIHTITGV